MYIVIMEKMISTNEDWYPNYQHNRIKITLQKDNPDTYRVSIWGEDDFGMEKIFSDYNTSLAQYNVLSDGVLRSELKMMGFIQA